MSDAIIWKCTECGTEFEACEGQEIDRCTNGCGGQMQRSGETYDQEFVEQKQYEARQDREYEERHRHDRY